MASGASSFLESAVLVAYLQTNPGFISLHTGANSDGANEVVGTNYARQSSLWSFAGSHPTVGQNSAQIDFPVAGGPWGNVSAVGIWDAASGGHMLFYADLALARVIGSGDTARFLVGSLTVSAN